MSFTPKSNRKPALDNPLKPLIDDLSSNRKVDDIRALSNSQNESEQRISNVESSLLLKQDRLVSGQNIKTINGLSILGPGNIVISGGGGVNYERRSDYVYPYHYSGTADVGTLDSGTWTIKRIDFTVSGSPVTQQATGAWTSRYSLTYI